MQKIWVFIIVFLSSGCVFGVSLSQLQLSTQKSPSCGSYEEMIAAEPTVHGKIEKKGILPLNLWWNVQGNSFFDNLNKTLSSKQIVYEDNQVLQGGYPISEPFQMPMSAQCQVYIDHKHKIIYIKTAKTAGNSVHHELKRQCLTPKERAAGDQCYIKADKETIKTEEDAIRIWNEYFVLSTTRNPYSRGSSAYSYMLKRRRTLGKQFKEGCTNSPSFKAFCKTPYIIGLQSQRYGCVDNNIHDYLHVEPQVPCLKTEDGQFVVDYIIGMETIYEDWAGVVDAMFEKQGLNETQINYYNILKQQPVLHENKVSSKSSYASEMFDNCGVECAQGLANYYKEDFQFLGYEDCMTSSAI